MSVGKRIFLKREMPDPAIMEQFRSIPASNTADVMNRSCAMNPRIHLVSNPKNQMVVGPAYTVKCRAGDNLTLHAALNFCQEGDVLVVSNEEDTTRASRCTAPEPLLAVLIRKAPARSMFPSPAAVLWFTRETSFWRTPMGLSPSPARMRLRSLRMRRSFRQQTKRSCWLLRTEPPIVTGSKNLWRKKATKS